MIMVVNIVKQADASHGKDNAVHMRAKLGANKITIISNGSVYEIKALSHDKEAKRALKELCETINGVGTGPTALKAGLLKQIKEGKDILRVSQDEREHVKVEYADPYGKEEGNKANSLRNLSSLVKQISKARFFQFGLKKDLKKRLEHEIKNIEKFDKDDWAAVDSKKPALKRFTEEQIDSGQVLPHHERSTFKTVPTEQKPLASTLPTKKPTRKQIEERGVVVEEPKVQSPVITELPPSNIPANKQAARSAQKHAPRPVTHRSKLPSVQENPKKEEAAVREQVWEGIWEKEWRAEAKPIYSEVELARMKEEAWRDSDDDGAVQAEPVKIHEGRAQASEVEMDDIVNFTVGLGKGAKKSTRKRGA